MLVEGVGGVREPEPGPGSRGGCLVVFGDVFDACAPSETWGAERGGGGLS
jgi:hypothetical protein